MRYTVSKDPLNGLHEMKQILRDLFHFIHGRGKILRLVKIYWHVRLWRSRNSKHR